MLSSGPSDPVIDFAQLRPSRWIDLLYPADSAIEMGAQVGMARAVLSARPAPAAVVQRGLEFVVRRPRHVSVFIHDDSRDSLRSRPTHDPRLRGIEREALLARDVRQSCQQCIDPPRERQVAREREIVGVAGVAPAQRARQAIASRSNTDCGVQVVQRPVNSRATALGYPKLRKSPWMRIALMLGKKSLRSAQTTMCSPAC